MNFQKFNFQNKHQNLRPMTVVSYMPQWKTNFYSSIGPGCSEMATYRFAGEVDQAI